MKLRICTYDSRVNVFIPISVQITYVDFDLKDDDYSMSLERLNTLEGYHASNCVLVLRRMNCTDMSVSSLYPDLVYHGMTKQKWKTIMLSVIQMINK